MVKIGITGGIGSGKTTVCDVWQSLGAYVINADDLAKKIMTNNEEVRQEIINTFGDQSYHPGGSLNRPFLAEQAFEKGRVEELNAIVHPRIPGEMDALIQEAARNGREVMVYEAALLLQNNRPGYLDFVVIVLANEAKRINRVKQRDRATGKRIRDRIKRQQNFSELSHLADIIIKNNGTLDELKERAEQVYQQFVSGCTD